MGPARCWSRVQCRVLRGPPISAARAAGIGIRVCGRRGIARFAHAEIGLLLGSTNAWGGGRLGRRAVQSCLRVTSLSRRPCAIAPVMRHGSSSDDEWRGRGNAITTTQYTVKASKGRRRGRLEASPAKQIPRKRAAASQTARHPNASVGCPGSRQKQPRKIFQPHPAAQKHTQQRRHTRERHHHNARHPVSSQRPPARPAGSGPRKMLHRPTSGGKNLKNPVLPRGREVSAIGARCGGGAG